MGCTVEYGKNEITVQGGKLRGIDVDMNAISDTVQTLAAVALFAEGPTTISRVAHIRHKETDRIRCIGRRTAQDRGRRGRTSRRAADNSRQAPRDKDRNLQRPPHGNEHGACGPGRPGNCHPGSGMHGENISGFFCRP